MRKLLAGAALGALLAVAPLAAATSASATDQPTTVTADQCFDSGGYFGGYNSAGQAYCEGGPYDGIPFDHDPLQGNCPDGQHMVWIYLQGFGCAPNVPNS